MRTLFDIRAYEGSQARAWEELTYQLRPAPGPGVIETRKTRAPDGGVEWYDVYDDGHEEGFQAKFYSDLISTLGAMKASTESVARLRGKMTTLTFVVPFDFTDNPSITTDQKRWDSATAEWTTSIEGADRLAFNVIRGGEILDLLALEKHAGRRAFWFKELELSSEWLQRQWNETRDVVGERYTPDAHTVAGVERELGAVALTPAYLESLTVQRDDALHACEEAQRAWGTDWTDVRSDLNRLQSISLAARPQDGKIEFGDAIQIVERLCDRSIRMATAHRKVSSLSRPAERADQSLRALKASLTGRRAELATSGSLALIGPAGQGKTHALLHAAKALLDSGTPSLVLAGQRFGDRQWWPETAGQLGDLQSTSTLFLGALSSMAEATGRRAVIMIDALNESRAPSSWAHELPSLLSQINSTPWLSLIVTWRQDYDDVISPPDALPVRTHHGFAGAEAEALRNYCDLFGIPKPAASVFDPAFSNPLFLRMYCEVRADSPSLDAADITRSTLFSIFARARAKTVLKKLKADPQSPAVQSAIETLAEALIENQGRPVPRSTLEASINRLLPDHRQWPDTLFASLQSEGLIETRPTLEGTETVAFPFQSFSEHLVLNRLLEQDEARLPARVRRRLGRPNGISRHAAKTIRRNRVYWRAAAVLLPERYGIELCDLVGSSDENWTLQEVTRTSLADRNLAAFGPRAFELLELGLRPNEDPSRAIETILTLATRAEHPASARWLHDRLRNILMPDRDATWSVVTFDVLDDSDTLQRVFDWAESDPSGADDATEVVALLLTWLLTSSNRPLRDHVTKVLVEVLRTRLDTATLLLERFVDVDDDYVRERLLTAVYGAVMRGGDSDHSSVRAIAEEINRWHCIGRLPINVLARDSARGAIAWAHARGLTNPDALTALSPPYGASAPPEPPTAEELERDFGLIEDDERTWRAQTILSSCLDWMGDFNKYVIAGDVDDFSLYPIDHPPPTKRDSHDPRHRVDADWAGRWVAARAIDLGWTVDRFESFESDRNLHSGREAHKPERIGKKYQWIAHHELMARLADNFHPAIQPWQTAVEPYAGPWPWFGRDIDPSLAPSISRDGALHVPVAYDKTAVWAVPRGPDLDLTIPAGGWVANSNDLPTTSQLLTPVDSEDREWLALYRHSRWTRNNHGRSPLRSLERDQFLLQFAWLARTGTGQQVYDIIRSRTLQGRWMPDRQKGRRQYLGEGWWSPIGRAEPAEWEGPNPLSEVGLEVLPATEGYLWEGSTLDCSLDRTVDFHTPINELLGNATWDGTRPEWSHEGVVVVRALIVEDDPDREHTILVVDPTWLESRLTELGMEIIIGTLGERHAASQEDEDMSSWSDVTYAGLLVPGKPLEMIGPLLTVQRTLD